MTHPSRLAHNFLRIIHFESRQLHFGASLSSPHTVSAWHKFADCVMNNLSITGDPFDELGAILQVTIQATLNAVAYDTAFNLLAYSEQFIKSYVPSSIQRAQFIGAHLSRISRLVTLARVLPPNSQSKTIDPYMGDVIKVELFAIEASLTSIASLVSVELIDDEYYSSRRAESAQLCVE
jgi:hypothetical protein